jgi:P-type Cu+ transporter
MKLRHCPERLIAALEPFRTHIALLRPFDDYRNPIMSISYQPSPPSFTIRDIIAALSAVTSPSSSQPLIVTVYHPPSLDDRAHALQTREQRSLLYRLLSAILLAVPTFIVGVVFMELVGDENSTRQYIMEPIWIGNVARAVWALFILATPVMFYSAGGYHKRSLKEVRALWRRRSKTPIWKRFVRFGSMNLLVSLSSRASGRYRTWSDGLFFKVSTGVAVAYFSSIALLALAAVQPKSSTGQGDTATYFDSVVFLTMFLLAGAYILFSADIFCKQKNTP